MIVYRFLTDADHDALHAAFQLAFSDYQVDMRMSRAQFDYRLLRDGIDLSKSVGAFEGNELVGFCMSGVGTWQGEPTIYDAGTGVVPQHRQHGLGKEMFNFMLPRLKDAGFSRYLLEVISSNEPAVNLYRKLGFKDTRKLVVFRITARLENNKSGGNVTVRESSLPDWELYQKFWDVEPSWQNSVDAAKRTAHQNAVLETYLDDRCVGYGVVARDSGNLFQLAIDKKQRRKGFASVLLDKLQLRVTTGEPLKVNNVDEVSKDSLLFYESTGFHLALSQYELSKAL